MQSKTTKEQVYKDQKFNEINTKSRNYLDILYYFVVFVLFLSLLVLVILAFFPNFFSLAIFLHGISLALIFFMTSFTIFSLFFSVENEKKGLRFLNILGGMLICGLWFFTVNILKLISETKLKYLNN